jgi:hypothetical protein
VEDAGSVERRSQAARTERIRTERIAKDRVWERFGITA